MKLSEKLEQLGAAGRARLGRAWLDPEVITADIEKRFRLITLDITALKVLLGDRPPRPGRFDWRQRDDDRNARDRKRRAQVAR